MQVISFVDLGAASPVLTFVFHPEHPLHHLVLDLEEQVDQAFEYWLAKAVPNSSITDNTVAA